MSRKKIETRIRKGIKEKKCTGCGEWKPDNIEHFLVNPHRSMKGAKFRTWCIKCNRMFNKGYSSGYLKAGRTKPINTMRTKRAQAVWNLQRRIKTMNTLLVRAAFSINHIKNLDDEIERLAGEEQ